MSGPAPVAPAPVDLAPAARRVAALLDGVGDDRLADPTPCSEYTVRDLIDHLLGLAVAFRDGAGKRATERVPEAGDWRTALPERLAELAAAWREPGAWEGVTEVGGVTAPAPMIGRFALNELVVHGWDLARATGQPYAPDPGELDELLPLLTETAGTSSGEGPFGPPVEVPADAPPLDRVVAFTGRDPAWSRP
ncbi:TIGR03086 family metal-binding protein [Streptomyces capparidis]